MNKLEDSVIKYAINFERYKNGQANEIINLLDKTNKQIAKFIKETDGVHTKARYKEIAQMLKEMSVSLKEKTGETIDIDGLIDYELKKERKLLKEAEPYIQKTKGKGEVNFLFPSREQIKTSALFQPITDDGYGMTYKSYLEGIETGLFNTWDTAVRTGYLTGQSTKEIVHNVLGAPTQVGKLKEIGQINTFRNAVYSNTRTALQSFANETMHRVYEANDDLFGDYDENGDLYKYEYLATLDSHTCLVCADSAHLYKELSDVPHVPQHRGCRCVVIPYFNIKGDTRATSKGQRRADLSFDEWLREQDEKTQKDVLGATRFRMFQDGTKISQFVDDGKVLNLDDLNLLVNGKAIKLESNITYSALTAKEFNNFEELEKKFNEIGISLTEGVRNVDGKGMSALYNEIRDINRRIFYVNKIGVANLDNGVVMQILPNGSLALNKELFKDFDVLTDMIKNAKNLPKGSTFHSVFMHEVGHSAEAIIGQYVYKDSNDFNSAWDTCEIATRIKEKAMLSCGLTNKEFKSYVENNISKYSLKDDSELLGEAFADSAINKKNSCKFAKTLKEVTMELLETIIMKGGAIWMKPDYQ